MLARQGILSPVFCSIEEYLGRNTKPYFDVLAQVGRGVWSPDGDAAPWVRFILTGHLRQARTLHRRIKESERLWDELEKIVDTYGLPERTMIALYDAAMRFRVRNGTYRAILADMENEISDQVASKALKLLTNVDLLVPHGAARGRYYTAAKQLAALMSGIVADRDPRDDSDPFDGA